MKDMRIFGLGVSAGYTDQICKSVLNRRDGIFANRSKHSEQYQEDGEPYIRSLENVRGCDVFVVSSLYSCVQERLADKFINLLFFARSLWDASAARVTLVCPYLAYQRQDRKTESRAPVYTKYVPELVEGLLGKDCRMITMDAHNLSAFQTGFRCRIDHLEAKPLFGEWLRNNLNLFSEVDLGNLVACSPDEGGVKRTGFYREKMQEVLGVDVGSAAVYKERKGSSVQTYGVMGNVKGKNVFMFDDMISSGKTALVAVQEIEKAGGKVAAFIATHGLFVGKANEYMEKLIEKGVRVIVCDTVPPFRLKPEIQQKLTVIPTAPMFAEAIQCINGEESISRLLS